MAIALISVCAEKVFGWLTSFTNSAQPQKLRWWRGACYKISVRQCMAAAQGSNCSFANANCHTFQRVHLLDASEDLCKKLIHHLLLSVI